MSRRLSGLLWARAAPRPSFIPKSRPRGAKAQGLRYERALAQALPQAIHGPWFEFCDRNGKGWCQPDLVLKQEGRIYVLECKFTDTPAARVQLQQLYIPILGQVFGLPVGGIVVCHTLTPESGQYIITDSLPAALLAARGGALPILHWLGHAPLIPSLASPRPGQQIGLAQPLPL